MNLSQIYRELGRADGGNEFLNTLKCSIRPVIRLSVPNILSSCKAEEEGDAVASLTDDNAAGDKIGGAESLITGRMEHWTLCLLNLPAYSSFLPVSLSNNSCTIIKTQGIIRKL